MNDATRMDVQRERKIESEKLRQKQDKEKRKNLESKWLAQRAQDDIMREEILREIPKGILLWYPFKKGKSALYIGNKEDACTELLCQKELDVTAVSVEEMTQEWIEDRKEKYAYIISVAALETTQRPAEILKILHELAEPKGVLLLAMNNRLGIRYFCGDRDPYTERNFDGIEDYKRVYHHVEDTFRGRCYSKAQLKSLLTEAGWEKQKIYSIFSDLKNPSLIMAEGYVTNEDLINRILPHYNYPNAVFLEEKNLYQTLVEEDLISNMANAFLFECPLHGEFCDVLQVTSSLDRGRENAMITRIHDNDTVDKCAVFSEGKDRLHQIAANAKRLRIRGISVVDVTIEDGELNMPFVKEKTGQVYLKELLYKDKGAFLQMMDRFRDLIFQSSDIAKPDRCDGNGAILENAFWDMVPSNSFVIDGEFVFFDQEFCVKNYPVNVLLYRMIVSLFYGDIGMSKYIKVEELLERYGLTEKKEIWQRAEWLFLNKLKNIGVLWSHYGKLQTQPDVIHSNRQRMNYSAEEYDKLFVDIFKNADTRKLILFGSGIFAQKFINLYQDSYPVYAIIDNQKNKWGTDIEGIPIHSPEFLRTLEKGQYKVIICIKNYLSVMKQLDVLGIGEYSIYDPNRNYPRKLSPIVSVKTDANVKHKQYNIGYVAGVFDMFHVGHVNLLRRAKEMCNYLIVGVLQDETVYKQKQKETIMCCEDRVEILKSCRYVDQVEVLPLDYAGIRDAYRLFHFDCQFSGDDHGDEDIWQKEKEYLNSQGADIVFFQYTDKVSSTMLREEWKEKS